MKAELIAGVRHLQSETSAPNWSLPRNPSMYAYEVEALASKLRWDRQKTATAFLEKNDENFFRGIETFKNTSAAATFNPHKPQTDTPYFIETSTLSDLDTLIPYSDGSIRHTHVVHVGPKGSGKTTVQNQWLYRNHDLLEQKKVFYVRCDAPKLFEFWERHYENPERWPLDGLPTIDEYLDFQTLCILAKYSHHRLPGEILAYLQKDNILFDYKEDRALDSPKRTKKSAAWYLTEHIARNISVYERGDATRSYLVGPAKSVFHRQLTEMSANSAVRCHCSPWITARKFNLNTIGNSISISSTLFSPYSAGFDKAKKAAFAALAACATMARINQRML